MSSREKDSADYDLERFIQMFDGAMTSDDPRVKNALRQLMMMVILTDHQDHESQVRRDPGPLQQLFDDVMSLRHRVAELERRMLATIPRESAESARPRGYQIGGQGGGAQWVPQSELYRQGLNLASQQASPPDPTVGLGSKYPPQGPPITPWMA